MKKATLKILKEKTGFSGTIKELFRVDSKFKDAVKIKRRDSVSKPELKHFKRLMYEMP